MSTINPQFPKRCSCGRGWHRETWAKLPLVGVCIIGGRELEWRNCVCGSTLSIPKDKMVAAKAS